LSASRISPILQLSSRDAEGGSPDPTCRIADCGAAIETLGEGLGDGVARHLTVAGEPKDRAPETVPVLSVEAVQLFIGLHTRHRISSLTLPGG
jgi:hypothetical protein